MEKGQQDFNLNATNLVTMVWDKRKLLMLIGMVAFVVSLLVSFLITPKFKSIAILYPPVSNQLSKEVVNTTFQRGLTVFGDEEEVEQLLQILSSQTLRDNIIRSQKLMKHWGIDSTSQFAWHTTYGYFSGNISFRPTAYRSVEIEVLDSDPVKAAAIANAIVDAADSLMRNVKAEMASEALKVLEQQYQILLIDVKTTADSLDMVMKSGATHLEAQTRELYRALAKAISDNNQAAQKRIDKKFLELASLGVPLTKHSNEYYMGLQQLKDLRAFMRVLSIESMKGIPSQFVVDRATPSDKKASPKKALIIVASTLSAIFFAIFMLVLIDFFKKSINPNAFSQE